MNNNLRIYVCEKSIDSIFTAIYDAWDSRYGHANIRIMEEENLDNMELFSEYITVVAQEEKARKVANSIKAKISEDAYALVCRCALSGTPGRADAIYRFLIHGYVIGGSIINNVSDPVVHPLFVADRYVNNETLHYLGFLRFSQLKNSVLFAKIRPVNDILVLIADHFSERLTDENWMILDEGRKNAIVHKAREPWFLTDASNIDESATKEYSDEERIMQVVWQRFVDTIGIEERTNKKLQYQMLPNRYREFMREVPYKV
jgi:probable DNA metabolism protein